MRSSIQRFAILLGFGVALAGLGTPGPAAAQDKTQLEQFRETGRGIQTSAFGTYVHKGEILVYPYFSRTIDHDREYQPDMFGVGGDVDYRGKFWSNEAGVMVSYGWKSWLALEFTTAYMTASLEKDRNDKYATPARTKESGLGDVEGQIRVRCLRETARAPELFAYLEVTAPTQRSKVLIGDEKWDVKPGFGFARGFSWGTLTIRTTGEYNQSESKADLGETSLEYLRRLSPAFQVFVAFEGGEGGPLDEWHVVSDLQWRLSKAVSLKIDNTVGVMSKSNDWEPQIGILFTSLP
ncbi:MAG TPA: hypothetical protein VJQ53_00450 [Candidatus Eisenbacteria bacterium]|nr:hypothetical protein [Candidatus Eisenbacteria bacterium]